MPLVLIPTTLRPFAGGTAELAMPGSTIIQALDALTAAHPRLRDQIMDPANGLRSFVALFLNGQDVRMLDGVDTPVSPADTLELVPAIAGGDAPRSFATWRRELQSAVETMAPAAALAFLADGAVALDVRTAQEWGQGHLPSAVHADRGFLEQSIENLVPDRTAPILCYCQSGVRSLFAAQALAYLGYERVVSLDGGLQAWKAEGLAVELPPQLSDAQRRRYLRHLAIPGVGEKGQARLLAARVLLVGAGGLGCPAGLYLAAAGVGTLGICDADIVDPSNLQRQVLHRADGIGRLKTESARDALQALNPDVAVRLHSERLDEAAARAIFPDYDLIIDGTDNFAARYVINDVAVGLGLPVVHGSVYRFDGQVGVFGLPGGPCYRCLHPAPPPPELAPSCAEGGVLGVLPGVIGLLQATEALKLLLGLGAPLSGRALRFDALAGSFRELRHAADPHCAVCGPAARAA
ncbi:molybdopterin-synthase adenylyltransferase MoeB [Sandaracinobacteroides saxicola]|uniref:Molybdopterin-synthase adenylyltransferase n=1 Tax=Sandaracinobacteroides saxicola TaxID=2759707 RepID=A0A7G5IIT0_9SPHN|nr:molybdopterin-synthase adenylyltransferase MoeB [Sandaracinobacteroides saxicola]QMW23272.1 molybdopterin-synthase adenylyltransferase MoeB [Sandaracinobacteroides saxicola]